MCGIDRTKATGFCREGGQIRVAKIIKNFEWEEPLVSGKKGTLAIFFSGCSLRCEFCQNYQISQIGKGDFYSPEAFAKLLKSFDYSKFDSVDFITPTHFSSLLAKALQIFKPPVPVVWNSSGYERVEVLQTLLPFVDVFLFDLKFYSPDLSKKLAKAEDYFDFASKAIIFAMQNKTDVIEDEILKQGVIVRHLVLPSEVSDSFKILDFLAKLGKPFISLMQQFTPIGKGSKNRKLYPLEFKAVLAHAQKLDFEKGYFQEEGCADEVYIPKF